MILFKILVYYNAQQNKRRRIHQCDGLSYCGIMSFRGVGIRLNSYISFVQN